MARRARRGGYRNNPYNAKAYKFTARRRAALKKAQAKSARERRIKVGIMAAGGIASVGVALYLGRNTSVGKGVRRDVAKQVRRFNPQRVGRAMNIARARAAVNPVNKEAVRVAGAISPAGTPHQAGHVGITPAPFPHAPGTEAPKVFTRTVIPTEDPSIVRGELEAEAAHRASAEGSLDKFMDPGDRGIPMRLVQGRALSKTSIRKALRARNKEVVKAGGQAMTGAEIESHVEKMIADGTIRSRVTGAQTTIRTNPQAVPHATAPNSGITQEQFDAITAMDTPQKPVLGTPTSKGGGRGVVKLPNSPPATSITIPGLGNAQSPFGTQVTPAPLTRGQKAAMTRARNKAAKANDAKPAEHPSTPAFSHAAPQAQPHSPSSPEVRERESWAARIGKPVGGWTSMSSELKQRAIDRANKSGYTITSSGLIYPTVGPGASYDKIK